MLVSVQWFVCEGICLSAIEIAYELRWLILTKRDTCERMQDCEMKFLVAEAVRRKKWASTRVFDLGLKRSHELQVTNVVGLLVRCNASRNMPDPLESVSKVCKRKTMRLNSFRVKARCKDITNLKMTHQQKHASDAFDCRIATSCDVRVKSAKF